MKPDEDKKNRRNQIKYFDRKTKLQTKGVLGMTGVEIQTQKSET